MEGIFIPMEFFKIKEINNSERMVLALYKYYTEKGKYKCSSLSNLQISEFLGKSRRHIIDIKNHLKELGLIKTTSGQTVYYVGKNSEAKNTTGEVKHTSGEAEFTSGGEVQVTTDGEEGFTGSEEHFTTDSEEGVTQEVKDGSLINIKKKKEEIKEDYKEDYKEDVKEDFKKGGKTNFERAIDELPPYYKTEDKIEYLKTNYATEIERINKFKECDTYLLISQIKSIIIKRFGVEEYHIDDTKKKQLDARAQLREQLEGFCYFDDSSYSKENTYTEPSDLKDKFFNW